MSASIILIGPTKIGKTTISKLLGSALGLPVIDLDELRWDYYAELEYDNAKAQEAVQQGGLRALISYWEPFSLHAVERVLQSYPNDHVIAFGAWHSIYDDEVLLHRAKLALEPFKHVILILPSPDLQESYTLLRQRHETAAPHLAPDEMSKMMVELKEFINYPSNNYLATHTIYTAGKSAEETWPSLHIAPKSAFEKI